MDLLQVLFYGGLGLLYFALVFIPMERVFPAKTNQPILRPAVLTDLFYFFGQYLIWNSLVTAALYQLYIWLQAHVNVVLPPLHLPIWLQVILLIAISDLCIYWAHRLQHRFDFLWRFHQVHHSAEHLDWLAAYREHPLDTIYTVGIINLPALIIGFDLNTITYIIAFRGIWAVYIHSNVRLPIGLIKMLIGSPELHHWHHDKERDRGNYANISPLMDILFGTYVCPPHGPTAVGLNTYFPKYYLGQMLFPLMPKSLQQLWVKHHSPAE